MNDDLREPEDDEVLDFDELLDHALGSGYRDRGNGDRSGSVIERLADSVGAIPTVQLRAPADDNRQILGPVESLCGR